MEGSIRKTAGEGFHYSFFLFQFVSSFVFRVYNIMYGTFQDQGTTCVSRQSDANFFISKRAETLNFFAPLRMMAGPIYHAKKTAGN